MQLYSTVNLVDSDAKTFNYSVFTRDGTYTHILIHMYLQCLPLAHMHVLCRAHHWSMDASMFNAVSDIYLHK